ncbi:hypothetical protein ACSFA8_11080 [Variovorax sp. RT4R15]|uniref:hypothetical protein n=1 Tax=Variovorax sp. RT4R15 TaxID=3443737 RepID=UPI003F474067
MPTILSIPSQTPAPAIGTALRELAVAAVHVLAALRATLFQTAATRPMSASEEAEQVRALAVSYLKTDRRFADDLFAAANRHELLNDA